MFTMSWMFFWGEFWHFWGFPHRLNFRRSLGAPGWFCFEPAGKWPGWYERVGNKLFPFSTATRPGWVLWVMIGFYTSKPTVAFSPMNHLNLFGLHMHMKFQDFSYSTWKISHGQGHTVGHWDRIGQWVSFSPTPEQDLSRLEPQEATRRRPLRIFIACCPLKPRVVGCGIPKRGRRRIDGFSRKKHEPNYKKWNWNLGTH